jgi:ribosome-associated GTPase EngA
MNKDKVEKKEYLPLIVIFGRTNAGKSTLFNCLIEKQQAIISNIEGTTRDSNMGKFRWRGKDFELVDTGGIMDLKFLLNKKNKVEMIDEKVQIQARDYLTRADLILFLVDVRAGILPQDKQMALFLKKNKQFLDKTLLLANKADSPKLRDEVFEFNKLNIGEPIPLSATNGSGTGDMLDIIVDRTKNISVKETPRVNTLKISEEENKNFVFLHGYKRTKKVIDPLDWLCKELDNKENFCEELPGYNKPDLEEQMEFVMNNAHIDQNTTIITHSLGSVLALKLLEKYNLKIKRLVMIAPLMQTFEFVDKKVREEIKDYGDGKYNFRKIRKLINEVIVFQDVKDNMVFPEDAESITKNLNADLIKMEAPVKHFNCKECDEILKKIESHISGEDEIRVCVLGQPNVGKSSLLNKILGYERVIVSDVAHTTREPQDTEIEYKGNKITLIDTAGISKKGTKTRGLQKFGIEKSLKSLKKSDIAILVIDVNRDITHQDQKIVQEIVDRKKSFIIVANKWDLVKDKDPKEFKEYIYSKMPFCKWAEIHFVSALTGSKVDKIMDLTLELYNERKIRVSDTVLSGFIKRLIQMHKPSRGSGTKKPRIYSFKQLDIDPPYFEIKIGAKEDLHFSYLNYIENRLRQKFGFKGTPIAMYVRKNKQIHGMHNN